MAESPENRVLLKPLPRYQVVLCTECSYCVLPSALPRHLKDIHRIWSAERESYISHLEHVDLWEPSDIVYPEPNDPPVPGLPVLDGYACEADSCSHLCVTLKRMQAHWRTEHARKFIPERHCRPVKLQTFFRGTNTKYFVVNDSPAQSDRRRRSSLAKIETKLGPTIHDMYFGGKYENEIDWYLLRHFEKHTWHNMAPLKSPNKCYRELVLQAAAENDFLRLLVLGTTASHIASKPIGEDKALYASRASRYGRLARQTFRLCVDRIDGGNINAVYYFSRIMPFYLLAEMQHPIGQKDSAHREMDDSMVPQWIPVQRASISLLQANVHLIAKWHQVPYQLMAVRRQDWKVDYGSNPYDGHLLELLSFIDSLPDSVELQSCAEALQVLRRCWATAFTNPEVVSFRDVAYWWGAIVSDEYLQLLEAETPVALLILAHVCVLWSFAEDCYWYMRGHAETFLTRIQGKLDEEWHDWLSWPVSIVLPFEMRG